MTPTATRRAVLSGVAAAATGTTLIAAAALAPGAAASPRAHSSLSIRAGHNAITLGQSDTIFGSLHSGKGRVGKQEIDLYDRTAGAGWTQEGTADTNRRGLVQFSVSPTQDTEYKLVFPGTAKVAPTHSGVVRVRVQQAGTLTISVGSASIDPGQTDTVSGVLTDANGQPVDGDTVVLVSHVPGKKKVHVEGTGTTGTDGSVSFTVSPTVTTAYRLIAKAKGDEARVRSEKAIILVRRPSSLSIRERADQKTTGQIIISGDLRGAGHALAGRKVTLQSSPSGAGTWSDVVTTRTNGRGYVADTEPAPTASTDYRLVFAGGKNFDGSTSGVVTVTASTSSS